MNSPTRMCLIGAGGIAASYVQAFQDHPDARLVAIVDVRPEAAANLAAKLPRVRTFASLDTALAEMDFEAAIVATPPNTHEELVLKLLAAGQQVLCEKPFTISTDSAVRMASAAVKADRVLTMASKFRYVADVLKAKSFVDEGLIGEVVLFENAFTARVDMTQRWNSNPAISGGGVLIDNGAHSLDLTRYFLGTLLELHAVEGRRLQPIPVEDTAQVFVRSATGVHGTIDLSWSINKERESYIEIQGVRGCIRVGWKSSKYKLSGGGDWVTFGHGYDKVQAFRDNIGNFARHLHGREPLTITIEDAIANVAAIDAAYRSMRMTQVDWTRLTPLQLAIS